MGLKDVLRKAASLVVEMPDEPTTTDASPLSASDFGIEVPKPTRTVEDVVKAAPGPNLDQIQVPSSVVQEPPVGPDGSPNFGVIYTQAGVPLVQFGAEEALGVINSLPAELPLDMKRKTVGATLSAMGKAMGVSTDSVVADASRKIAALNSFVDQLGSQTDQYVTLCNQKIDALKAEIAVHETNITNAKGKLDHAVKLCEAEGDRVDDVLEFFTLDQAPSKYA